MFSGVVQPGIVSLFSSTGSEPLGLFSSRTDASLPSDSFLCFLEDSSSSPPPAPPATLIASPSVRTDVDGKDSDEKEGYTLSQTVLHLQSPTLRTTYIRCPPQGSKEDLGLKHPWIHIQVRDMGREWSFEVGVVDKAGREGIIRFSTFQKEPRLKLLNPPLLHLPLSFPSSSSHRLTGWSTIDVNLPSLLPHFSSASLARNEDDGSSDTEMPSRSAHIASNIYATCRLRRIWFSESGPGQSVPWEFQLFGPA
ncbi:unnamed protein product [Somion occarium]|uniref:CFA20 domain-containing protein n=1 Tax=Somion occarium TaxID=3059160 RepID=A0ABP1CY79_9APHY